jgi:hypothetical protein
LAKDIDLSRTDQRPSQTIVADFAIKAAGAQSIYLAMFAGSEPTFGSDAEEWIWRKSVSGVKPARPKPGQMVRNKTGEESSKRPS